MNCYSREIVLPLDANLGFVTIYEYRKHLGVDALFLLCSRLIACGGSIPEGRVAIGTCDTLMSFALLQFLLARPT